MSELNPSKRANQLREQGKIGAYMEGTNPNNVKLLERGGDHNLPVSTEASFQHKAGAAAVFLKEAEAATNQGDK